MSSPTRIKYFDALKFFAIFSVLMVHTLASGRLFCFIGTYHMPLFMTISGFFGAHIMSKPFKDVLLNKARRLLLPAICMGIIPMLLIGCEPISTIKSGYWFLRSAFVCAMFYYFACKYRKLAIPIFIIATTIWVWGVWWLYPCYIVGAFIHDHYEKFTAHLCKILIISLAVYIFMLCIGDERFYDHEGFTALPYKYANVSGWGRYIIIMACIRLYRIILGVAGSIFFISLFGLLARYIPQTKLGDLLCRFGEESLGIYILQSFIIETYIAENYDFSGLNINLFQFVVAPLICFATTIICVGIIRLIRRSKVLTLFLLGENPKSAKPV